MEKPHHTAIYWFRRSLRLDDNRGLSEAVAEAKEVVPVFILDPTILTRPDTGGARTHFLFESLAAVDTELRKRGGRLIIRHGKPVEELERLVHETGTTLLCYGRDYEPYSRQRDAMVDAAMTKRGVTIYQSEDHLLAEPEEVISPSSGKTYTVYTPYKKVWFSRSLDFPMAPIPERIVVPKDLKSEVLPKLPESVGVAVVAGQKPVVQGGETEAHHHLAEFLNRAVGGVGEYKTARDFPGIEGTSRLSAYLRMGVLSPRRLVAAVRERRKTMHTGVESIETFLSELAWRDFFYQILWHYPTVAEGAFREEYNALSWENDETLFQAWCAGQTGYPIVDAAMRQLNAEAWMHNRARMIVASFLTKDLLIDWRWGERYFMQRLIDGDLAANNGGWQWTASTGTDAQPYFRIFNPVAQGERFDPEGAYVRQWVPELRKVPTKMIHKPWKLSVTEQQAVNCRLGKDYPQPIVDHKVQREKALALYRQVVKVEGNN